MTDASSSFDPQALTIAARQGDGEAAHRLAVMSGMGLGVAQDWRAAFEWLDRAALAGHVLAQRQMNLLTGPGGNVELARLTTPPPARVVSDGPVIVVSVDMLNPALCDWIIQRAQGFMEPATVFDAGSGDARLEGGRSNSVAQFDLSRMDVVLALTRHRLAASAGLPVSCLEWTHVLRYEAGQTFDWHVDYLDPATPGFALDIERRGQRIVTSLVYLNEDFQGGETAFAADARRHRGRTGDALMWANALPNGEIDDRTAHAGLPPSAGRKWVLSQWMRNRPQF